VRVLVTGATGFVGYHAARALFARGHEVRVLARRLAKAEPLFRSQREVEISVGDMTDGPAVAAALNGVDAVLHAAATVSFASASAEALRDANVVGVRNVLGVAAERGLAPLLYVSSLTTLFDPAAPDPTQDSPVIEAHSPYTRAKAAAELEVRRLVAAGARIATVYPNAVIGPDDPGWSESVAALRGFMSRCLATSGGVGFVDARDLAALFVALLEADATGRYLLGGQFRSWDALAADLAAVLGRAPRRLRLSGRTLRGLGAAVDAVRRVRAIDSPISREGMEHATRMRALPNTAALARFGIALRPVPETLADTARWMLATRRLRPHHAPALAAPEADAAAT
jgi:nucleoside-diphosphate-sugar epimerase